MSDIEMSEAKTAELFQALQGLIDRRYPGAARAESALHELEERYQRLATQRQVESDVRDAHATQGFTNAMIDAQIALWLAGGKGRFFECRHVEAKHAAGACWAVMLQTRKQQITQDGRTYSVESKSFRSKSRAQALQQAAEWTIGK